MLSPRRAAREAALLVMFAVDAGRIDDPDEALETFAAHLRDDTEVVDNLFGPDEGGAKPGFFAHVQRQLSDEGQWPFVERLVKGAMDHQQAIDNLIGRCSLNWKLSRMSRVDRNILRLAAYELAFEPDVPGRATLNEAIELAKRYGAEDSGKFVNGILDRIAQDLGRLEDQDDDHAG